MNFSVNNENATELKYFLFKNECIVAVSKREQLPDDGQVRSKHVAVDGDFNAILN
jgi:hypothetical protein